MPGWLGQLSICLLISAQVMISGSWDGAPHQAELSQEFETLSLAPLSQINIFLKITSYLAWLGIVSYSAYKMDLDFQPHALIKQRAVLCTVPIVISNVYPFSVTGCDLSFPGNKLVSGDHCKIIVDEKSGQVSLEDTR